MYICLYMQINSKQLDINMDNYSDKQKREL